MCALSRLGSSGMKDGRQRRMKQEMSLRALLASQSELLCRPTNASSRVHLYFTDFEPPEYETTEFQGAEGFIEFDTLGLHHVVVSEASTAQTEIRVRDRRRGGLEHG